MCRGFFASIYAMIGTLSVLAVLILLKNFNLQLDDHLYLYKQTYLIKWSLIAVASYFIAVIIIVHGNFLSNYRIGLPAATVLMLIGGTLAVLLLLCSTILTGNVSVVHAQPCFNLCVYLFIVIIMNTVAVSICLSLTACRLHKELHFYNIMYETDFSDYAIAEEVV